jgi:hypothetical protein
MVLFFDKSAGLFGAKEVGGGAPFWVDGHFINLVSDMEKWKRLPESRQWNTFKKHLEQIAEVSIAFRDDKPWTGIVQEKLSDLPRLQTYLFTVDGGSHTGYALATKKDNGLLNIKVFNSFHDILSHDDLRPRESYIEWDDLPVENYLYKQMHSLSSSQFLVSYTHNSQLPKNLAKHMKIKGQRIGSCPGYKFWLVAKYDLETFPRFVEFSVALHLWFIEDLAANFEQRMREWDAKLTRGWFAITRTPHFEGQLLKDLEDIKTEDFGMYAKLRRQIIESVQRRYSSLYPELNWEDEYAVLAFIHWKKKYLEMIHP